MDRDPFDLVGDTIDGQFRIDEFAGEGDLSVVYKGYHLGVDAIVAVKCLNLPATLDPALVEPFVRSFREGSKLHYKLARDNLNIAQSLSSGTTMAPRTGQVVPYLVREWLEGRSLTAELARRRAEGLPGMTLDEVMELLAGAADGLSFAHAHGVPHHSINPGNLFVVTKGDVPAVKLLDFGVAKVMNEEGLTPSAERGRSAGLRVLMPQYAAPEQLDQQVGPLGMATDIYSLALVIIEMLAGRPVMSSNEAAPVLHLDPTSRPTPRACGVTLRRRAEEVLTKAVSLSPASRQPDATVFWQELTEAALLARQPSVSPARRASLAPEPPKQAGPPKRPTPPPMKATPPPMKAIPPPAKVTAPKQAPPADPPVVPALTLPDPVEQPLKPTMATPSPKPVPVVPPLATPKPAPVAPTAAPPSGPAALPASFNVTRKTLQGFGPVSLEDAMRAAVARAPAPAPAPADEGPAAPPRAPAPPAELVPPPAPRAVAPPPALKVPTPVPFDLPSVIVEGPPPTERARRHAETTRLPRYLDLAPPPRRRSWVLGAVVIAGAALGGVAFAARHVLARYAAAPSAHSEAVGTTVAATQPLATAAVPHDGASAPAGASAPSAEAPVASVEPAAPVARVAAKRFTKAAAVAALDQAAAGLADCRGLGPLWGAGSIRASFKNDGSVARLMLGPPYAGTPEGNCIAERFRAAQMAPFGGMVGAINYTFALAK